MNMLSFIIAISIIAFVFIAMIIAVKIENYKNRQRGYIRVTKFNNYTYKDRLYDITVRVVSKTSPCWKSTMRVEVRSMGSEILLYEKIYYGVANNQLEEEVLIYNDYIDKAIGEYEQNIVSRKEAARMRGSNTKIIYMK